MGKAAAACNPARVTVKAATAKVKKTAKVVSVFNPALVTLKAAAACNPVLVTVKAAAVSSPRAARLARHRVRLHRNHQARLRVVRLARPRAAVMMAAQRRRSRRL